MGKIIQMFLLNVNAPVSLTALQSWRIAKK